jgi:hypothetical protein
MIIRTNDDSYLIYTVNWDIIDIEHIKSYKKGDGTKLINELKKIAIELGFIVYYNIKINTLNNISMNALM